MSVLIKGMQIPKNCEVCLFSDWSNLHQTSCCKLKEYEPGFQYYSIAYRTQRSNICPLVELPEHHGDLVDVNEIRWDDHYDSDGNLSKYKVAYSDEMPDPVIKGEQSNNECIS